MCELNKDKVDEVTRQAISKLHDDMERDDLRSRRYTFLLFVLAIVNWGGAIFNYINHKNSSKAIRNTHENTNCGTNCPGNCKNCFQFSPSDSLVMKDTLGGKP